jgi:predicted RNA binding protein YcfA (HicA-like mRNA interferase family)
LKSISGKELCKILSNKGWILKRINGSHHIYYKEGISIRISVPVHGNKDLKIGLLRHIMVLAELTESDL